MIYSDLPVLLEPVKLATFWAIISLLMTKDETINTGLLKEIEDTCLSHGSGKEERSTVTPR